MKTSSWKGKTNSPLLPRSVIQKQMAYMLGRHGMFLELNEDVEDYEDLTEIMSNVQLNSNFLALAREVRGGTKTDERRELQRLHLFCYVSNGEMIVEEILARQNKDI